MIFEGWEVGSGGAKADEGGRAGRWTGGIDRGLSIDRSCQSAASRIRCNRLSNRLAAGRQRRDRRNTDPGFHGRIEEHGFHNWFGFYDNSFRQIRDCYAELDRAPGSPLATWQEAFIPGHEFVFIESFNGRTSEWLVRAPPNDETPGVGRGFLPLWEYVLMLVEALYDHFHAPAPAGTRRREAVRCARPRGARLHLTIARHLARMMSRQPVEERARRHGMAPARPFAALEKLPLRACAT